MSDEEVNSIIVTGARLVGQVDAPQPAILSLDSEEIAAYGASTVEDLLGLLNSQISSASGRGGGGQVFLVNGRRIASRREIATLPSEAIDRIDVFTEEVALQYGYSADQRVVNLVLKDDFSATTVEGEYSQPWRGGFSSAEVEGNFLQLDDPNRLNINLEYDRSTLLTEAERGIIQSPGTIPGLPTDPDPAAFRSLRGKSDSLEATVNWSTGIGQTGDSLSLNATFDRDDGRSLQGLDTVLLTDPAGTSVLRSFNVLDPLVVDTRSNSYSAAANYLARWRDWDISATLDATLADRRSNIERQLDVTDLQDAAAAGSLALDAELGPFPDAGFAQSLTDSYVINALATGRTRPFELPAGEASLTLVTGYQGTGIESSDTRNLANAIDLDRNRFQLGANLGLPLLGNGDWTDDAIGTVTLNLNANIYEQSDFGTLLDWTTGLIWSVTDSLTLSATYLSRESSPSLTQLGAPTLATPNVPVFDLANNETVLATVISGGNPLLPAQQESDWRFAVNWQLPFLEGGFVQLEYFDNTSDDITEGFPLLTPAIEAAFPDRVTRDGAGRLLELDDRFVTFARQDQRRLSLQIGASGTLGGGGQDGARGGGGGPPPGVARGGGTGGGQGSGQGAGRPDAAQFAAMRERFCNTEPDELVRLFNAVLEAAANGDPPPTGEDGQPIAIPPQMLARLTGDDGRIDPERLAAIRARFCGGDGAAAGGGGPPSAAQGGGARPQGRSQGRPQGRRGGGGRGFGRSGGGGDGPPQWRYFANFNWTYELENTVLIADGIPELDLLDGDALSGGGRPQHVIRWRSGLFYDGMGILPFANYTGASRIDGSGLPGSTDLFFDDLLTVDIRTFVDLGERDWLVDAVPFFENTRVGFDVLNVFDARQRVTDSNGDVPLRFQPFRIDPVGRQFQVEFRKLF